MVDEVLSYLASDKSKTYVDCTFGQGGYCRKILENTECNIIAIDRDKDAKKYAELLKKKYPKNFIFNINNFSRIDYVLNLFLAYASNMKPLREKVNRKDFGNGM